MTEDSLYSEFFGRIGAMDFAYTPDWLSQLVEQVNTQHPTGEIIVSSGHSPSGVYHVGTLREIMTANAITWALRRAGREARHIDFVDDYDAFRKIPVDVPEEWKQYIGMPLAVVPDPWGDCHPNYGAHRLQDLHEALEAMDCMPDEIVSGYETYKQGKLAEQIAASLDRLDEVKAIITEVGGRQLDEHWAPVQILDDEQNLRRRKFAGWDAKKRLVQWRDSQGNTGELPIDDGRVKLDWRLDWPARWAKWGVAVEPFGRDHATKGGSYDTGKVLVDKIFSGQAPYPVPYEFINSLGQTKKMSKSSGDVLTPKDALAVMPAEILRYFVVGPRPSRTLVFDAGLGLYTLIDEFAAIKGESMTMAAAYARSSAAQDLVADVPFNHLVAVYQAAQGDLNEVLEILRRTGYEEAADKQAAIIERELKFVQNWLVKYAPESVKFMVQPNLPEVELNEAQRIFLAKLAAALDGDGDMDGQAMHEAIYAAAGEAEIKGGEAFRALYRVILGKDSGPKAGWFLSSLERPWLVERLQAGARG